MSEKLAASAVYTRSWWARVSALDMASNLMLVDEHLLWLAQREDKACSGIVGALERIGGAALSSHAQHISVVMWVS